MTTLNQTAKNLDTVPAIQMPGHTQAIQRSNSIGVKRPQVFDLAPTMHDARVVTLNADPQVLEIIQLFRRNDLFSSHEWTSNTIRQLNRSVRHPVPEMRLTLEKATTWVQAKIEEIHPHEMSPDDWFMSDRNLDFFLAAWPAIWRELNRRLFENDGAEVAIYFADLAGFREQFAGQVNHYQEAWSLSRDLQPSSTLTPGSPCTFKHFILDHINDSNFTNDPRADVIGVYLAMFAVKENWPELTELLGLRLMINLKQLPYRYLQLLDYGCPVNFWLSFAAKPLPDFRRLTFNLHQVMSARKEACLNARVDIQALLKSFA